MKKFNQKHGVGRPLVVSLSTNSNPQERGGDDRKHKNNRQGRTFDLKGTLRTGNCRRYRGEFRGKGKESPENMGWKGKGGEYFPVREGRGIFETLWGRKL